jgi:CheY-like chemotaxis protein
MLPQPSPSLLITDDDRSFRETLGQAFADRGFRTLYAADGEEALEIVRAEPIHVALFDMHMPRLTGLETLHRLRTLEIEPFPCILMTAALTDLIARQAREEQAFAALSKPFGFRVMFDLVLDAMRRQYGWELDERN